MEATEYDSYWDAETIARAELIKADEDRMKAARPHLEKMQQEELAKAKAISKIIKKGEKNGF